MAYWYDGAALAATGSPVIALFWCLIKFTTTTTTTTASVTLSDTKESVDFYDCVSTLISNIPSRDLQIVCGDFNAPLQRDGHRVKNSCGIPTVNSDLLTQFIEANDLIPMNGYLRQKTNQLHTF